MNEVYSWYRILTSLPNQWQNEVQHSNKHTVEGEWFGMYKTEDSLLPVVLFYTTKDFKVMCHPHT
jgi:hypothetical protein